PRRIVWNVDWIELLLDWLEENPKERQKLFSDSSKDAKDEGRCKHVAKGSKSEFHRMIAAVVFSVDSDADICVDFQVNPTNYTKSVDNYIISSLEKLSVDFPYWKRLHGFWHTLPNFNPYTALSEPGQD
ncbi:hypothetical protein DFH94DRAFT_614722, partial [Russula ochroleuca]